MRSTRLGPLWGLVLAACTSSDVYGSTAAGHGASSGRGATGAQAAATSGSGGATTGTAGTSGGSGGTTGASACVPLSAGCPTHETSLPLDDCDAGLELLFNLTDTSDHALPCVPFQDAANAVAPAITDGCGFAHICAPAGTQISLIASPDGYIPMNLPTVALNQSTRLPQLDLLPGAGLAAIASQLQPPYDAADAFLVIQIAVDGGPSACSNVAGWTVGAVAVDGGPVGQGTLYTRADLPSPGTTITDDTGFAVVYNIDPAVGVVSPIADNAANDDAGLSCPNINFALPLELTNTVRVASGIGSVILYEIP